MKDPAFEGYIAAIEAHLSRRRGREHVLSPPDFQMARGWYEAGVSPAVVCAGIDEAFSTGDAPTSLTFCRRFVEALARPARET